MANPLQQNFAGFTIDLVSGDLLTTPATAIVNSVGGDINLYNAGVLARNIGQQGGPTIQNELSQKVAEFADEKVVVTGSGTLRSCQYILHLKNSIHHRDRFQPRIIRALQMAEDAGFGDIAFPALGSGGCGHTPMAMCLIFIEAIQEFSRETRGTRRHLTRIKFVFQNDETKNVYVQMFRMGGGGGTGTRHVTASQPVSAVVVSQIIHRGPANRTSIQGRNSGRSTGTQNSQGIQAVTGVTPATPNTGTNASSQGPGASSMSSVAAQTFQCKICLSVMRHPVVACVNCMQLIGCNQCVTRSLTSTSARCPLCRHAWTPGGRNVVQLAGLGGFLDELSQNG